MKKFLALIMATLMIVGIVSVPAAAGFAGSDDVEIVYTEADHTLTVSVSAAAFNKAYAAKTFTTEDFDALLPDDLVEAYRENGITGLFTCSAVKGIITRDQLFDIIPEDIFADPDSITVSNLKANKSMVKGMIADVYATIESIKVNGIETLTEDASYNYVLDIGAVEEAFLAGLPQTSAALASDPTAVYAVTFDFGPKGATEATVKVTFAGTENELTTLKSNLQSVASRFVYEINGKMIDVAGLVAKEQCAYVAKFIDSASISTETKLEVLLALNGTLGDVLDIITSRSLDELQDIVAKLDNETIDNANKLIDKYSDQAEKAYEEVKKYLDKALGDKLDKEFGDSYLGNGVFQGKKDVAYTADEIVDILAGKVSSAEQVRSYLTGTATLGVTTKFTCEDLFKTTFHIGTDSFDVYMPEGVEFEDIMAILETADTSSVAYKLTEIENWGKSTDEGVTFESVVTATAGADMDVYACATVVFEADNAEVSSKVYPIGYTLVAADIPEIPAKEGFTAGEWYNKDNETVAPLGWTVDGNATFTVKYTADETTPEETTGPVNPPTGIDEVGSTKQNNSLVFALAAAAVVASAGVVVCIRRKKEN